MNWLRDLPIRRKLTLVILLTCSVVVLLACGVLALYQALNFREGMVRDATALADVLAKNTQAALTFQDENAARQTLLALQAEPTVNAACLYDGKGDRFTDYQREGVEVSFPNQPSGDGYHFEKSSLVIFRPVILNDKRIGTIYLQTGLEEMYGQLRLFAGITAIVLMGSVLVALVLSSRLQRPISQPILALAKTAKQVSEKKDYSVRAKKQSSDELGLLTDSFNEMLANIEQRTQALQKANESLQAQTSQLVESAGVLASSSSEILTATSQLASTAIDTAAAVSQATSTVEEVRQTARISSDKAMHVAESSQKGVQISQSGRKSAEDTIEGMKRIRAQMESIAESMVRLINQTTAIGEIIASVDDISQQSNLLAVNAAIEAAKAGEHGTGFAVVAEAIKNLASQSKQATAQVRIILTDIQKATRGAVLATEQGSKVVEAGSIQSALAVDSISQLADNIAVAAQSATQIAATSQQQAVGMEQVVGAMESIKLASQQTVTSTKQADAAAKNLHQLGQKLKELIERVKL